MYIKNKYKPGDLVRVKKCADIANKASYGIILSNTKNNIFETIEVYKLLCNNKISIYTTLMFEKCIQNND
jgi:hypothetical protein|tara:strand:- start:31 stop:240 length:210 start_codon:yes stop_codon:yes gene_type:complete